MNRIRRLLRFVAVVCAAAMAAACTSTAPAPVVEDIGLEPFIVPTTGIGVTTRATVTTAATSQFSVRFHGIIVHADMVPYATSPWRAALISGDFGRQHSPWLSVSVPSDPAALAKLKRTLTAVTNQVVRCNQDQCRVRIQGLAMRIRGNAAPAPDVTIGPSFDCLLPRLRDDRNLNGGEILAEVRKPATDQRAVLPSAPAVGYFEIEGGRLQAAPTDKTGYFTEPYDACVKATNDPAGCEKTLCRQFPGLVKWSGTTDGPAKLYIASQWTAWKWEEIPTANPGKLMVHVDNESSDRHPDPTHFALNEKLLPYAHLPAITVGCTLDPGKLCPMELPVAIAVVPGCVDNQWP